MHENQNPWIKWIHSMEIRGNKQIAIHISKTTEVKRKINENIEQKTGNPELAQNRVKRCTEILTCY